MSTEDADFIEWELARKSGRLSEEDRSKPVPEPTDPDLKGRTTVFLKRRLAEIRADATKTPQQRALESRGTYDPKTGVIVCKQSNPVARSPAGFLLPAKGDRTLKFGACKY